MRALSTASARGHRGLKPTDGLVYTTHADDLGLQLRRLASSVYHAAAPDDAPAGARRLRHAGSRCPHLARPAVLRRGPSHPCGPSAQRCSPTDWPASARPVYHLKDLSCGESDPNGPFWDAKHKMYHLFYQVSIGEANPAVPTGGGPIWGHAASRDMVRWTHLPIPMWNDRWYDDVALFSGSATIVDGVPHMVYPGLCDTAHADCRVSGTGAHHMDYIAVIPANLSDPLYVNWTKPSYNPLVLGSAGDPSAAWQTEHGGEWRFVGTATHEPTTPVIQNVSATLYAAPRFEGPWKLVGLQEGFHAGEMPTLFPLPPLYPGTAKARGELLPTHVHKRGPGSRADPARNMVQIGTYVDGAPGSTGVWSAFTNETEMDKLPWLHSAKDFWDGAKGRRIFWGWVGSAKAIPRAVTYHPKLKQLVWSPIEEMAQLHVGATPLASVVSVPLQQSGRPHSLLPAAAAAAAAAAASGAALYAGGGTAADVNVSFAWPESASTLAVEVLGGTLTAFIEFVPPPQRLAAANESTGFSVRVGVAPGSHAPSPPAPAGSNATSANVSRLMPNTDLGGADYSISHHPAGWTSADCEALCDGQAKCKAWVWAVRGHPAGSGDCCLKEALPCPVHKPPLPTETVTSGAKVAGLQHCCQCTRQHCDCPHDSGEGAEEVWALRRRRPPPAITLATDTLQLLPSDSTLDMRIFTDNGIVEVYWMDGRVVMTAITPLDLRSGSITMSSTGANTTASATAWAMGGIWTSAERVLGSKTDDDHDAERLVSWRSD